MFRNRLNCLDIIFVSLQVVTIVILLRSNTATVPVSEHNNQNVPEDVVDTVVIKDKLKSNEHFDFKEILSDHQQKQKQRDEAIIGEIKSKLVYHQKNSKLKISKPNRQHFSQNSQDKMISKILRQKRNGIFFEAGALDGELYSNTLYFERELNWTGLLVEPGPTSFRTLKSRNRNANLLEACISPTKLPNFFAFDSKGGSSAFAKLSDNQHKGMQIKCYPLYYLIMAMGNPVIDYLSLDIEGDELKVLSTVPWELVHVKILDVEISRILPEGSEAVRTYMEHRGYTFYMQIGEDYIFYDPAYESELDMSFRKLDNSKP